MDGRDTMPTSGLGYLEALQQQCREIGVGTSPASPAATSPWTAICAGKKNARPSTPWSPAPRRAASTPTPSPASATSTTPASPTSSSRPSPSIPHGLIRDEDVVINFNYRADRVRQITRVLARNAPGSTKDRAATSPSRRARRRDPRSQRSPTISTTSA